MTTSRERAIQQTLLARREELQGRRHEEQTALRDSGRDANSDEADESAADLAAGLDLALLALRVETIQHIDKALELLAAGRYGRCVTCSSEIPEGRLRALPFADECRECAEVTEQTRGRGGRIAPAWERAADV